MVRYLVGAVSVALLTGAWNARTGAERARTPLLLVRVLEDASRQPLPNAEVIDRETGQSRFTNAEGETRLPFPPSGHLRLRVRQLGFQFVERDVARSTAPDATLDTIAISLARVAYTLPDVTTLATSSCAPDGDPVARTLSALALGQLRMGAERYETLRKTYPFHITQKRRTVRYFADGKPREIREGNERASSDDWGERYRPGRVIDRSSAGFSAPLLFLASLGDSVFWAHHCFTVRGVESFAADRVLRLEFVPSPMVTTVDWMGTALIDSATSVLRRVEFQMSGLAEKDVPRRLEGFTTFRWPSPYIVVPDSTFAMWWRRDLDTAPGSWTGPDVVQLIHVLEVNYRKKKPPASSTR